MKYHVHVYKLAGLGEVDVDADSNEGAMSEGLTKVKIGEVTCDKNPGSEYLAMAFKKEVVQSEVEACDVAIETKQKEVAILVKEI
jgi:hypothetical protein